MTPGIEGAAEFCKKTGYTRDEFIRFLRTTYPVTEDDVAKAIQKYDTTEQLLNENYLKTRKMENVVYLDRNGATVGQFDSFRIFQRMDYIWPWVDGYSPTESDWINIGWKVIKGGSNNGRA